MHSYIHEGPDWPRFTWNASIEPLLIQVAYRQGVLAGRVRSLGFGVDFGTATMTVLTEEDALLKANVAS